VPEGEGERVGGRVVSRGERDPDLLNLSADASDRRGECVGDRVGEHPGDLVVEPGEKHRPAKQRCGIVAVQRIEKGGEQAIGQASGEEGGIEHPPHGPPRPVQRVEEADRQITFDRGTDPVRQDGERPGMEQRVENAAPRVMLGDVAIDDAGGQVRRQRAQAAPAAKRLQVAQDGPVPVRAVTDEDAPPQSQREDWAGASPLGQQPNGIARPPPEVAEAGRTYRAGHRGHGYVRPFHRAVRRRASR
jgi:hypothetical protein